MALLVRDLAERVQRSYEWYREHRGEASSIEKRLELTERFIEDHYALLSHFLEYLAADKGVTPDRPLVQVPRLVRNW